MTREQALRADRLVRSYEDHSSGWFWETDAEGKLTYLSAKVMSVLEADGVPTLGARLSDVFKLDAGQGETARSLSFHLTARTPFASCSVKGAKGLSDSWWSISGRPWVDARGNFNGFVGTGSDLTHIRRSEAEITKLALFDSLTGLTNRPSMRATLNQLLAESRRNSRPVALLLLDLDRFKLVNDTLGHQTGDELLRQAASRLTRAVGDVGLVGRLGGDEFEVVLPNEHARERLSQFASRIIEALSEPYFINNSPISIGCSIGVAIAPHDGDDAETLVRNADLALYRAKADGRGVHRFFESEMLAAARDRKILEDDLRQALNAGELYLNYQQVVSTTDATIVGYEALLRWRHPVRGEISPTEFIPVAEECGLIEVIGEWVLNTACRDAVQWPAGMRVAVNVSPLQFANPGLPAIVTRAIAAAGIEPDRVELEITESVFLNDDAWSERMFKALKGIGVRLALDDFGTGYSSLGYLRTAPFDKIKIDQSFVRGAIIAGNRNAAIIRAIVTLADTLGMETTAEGVEQCDEIELIANLGCSHIQGYVYGKPAGQSDLLDHHRIHGNMATTKGHRVTRSPRLTMLRNARVGIAGLFRQGRIRNMSKTGAMIEGVTAEAGSDVLIEILEGEILRGIVKWSEGATAGIEFEQSFDLDRLK